MSETQMQSSGKERTFESGAVRDAGKKPLLQLISPHALMRLGEWLRFACEDRKPKPYAPRNWEKGLPFSDTIGAMERHIQKLKLGMEDEDHVAAILFGGMVLAHEQEEIKAGRMDPFLDDMPHYEQRPVLPPPSCLDDAAILRRDELQERVDAEEEPAEPRLGDRRINPKTGRKEILVQASKDIIARVIEDIPTYYVCGPMRGYPFLNFPAFDGARDLGLSLGFNIISPADIDREWGINPIEDPGCQERIEQQTANDPDFIKKIVIRDLATIINLNPKNGSGLALLPEWEDSTGATAEIAVAHWLGLNFVDAMTFEPIDDPLEV